MRARQLTLIAALLLPSAAIAQTQPTDNTTNPSSSQRVQGTGAPNRGDPVNVRSVTCSNGACIEGGGGSKQEVATVASANSAAPAQTVYGGDYYLSCIASAYGSGVQLQGLGPDGSTYLNAGSPITANGSTGYSIGSNAVVRVVLTGTTGAACNLSRVP